jgi:hypothetical protein
MYGIEAIHEMMLYISTMISWSAVHPGSEGRMKSSSKKEGRDKVRARKALGAEESSLH